MLEFLIIYMFVMVARYLPLRNKAYEELNSKEKLNVEKAFKNYKRTRKGKNDFDATEESYYPKVQKMGLTFLIFGIVLIPVYIAAVYFLYLGEF